MRAKARMKAKHKRVMRDIEHKISHEVVDYATERTGQHDRHRRHTEHRGRHRQGQGAQRPDESLDHGKIRFSIEYKAEAEGIKVAPGR